MPLTEDERAALWRQNRAQRQAQHSLLRSALRGSEVVRARIVAAWQPVIADPLVDDDPLDDPQLANWNDA